MFFDDDFIDLRNEQVSEDIGIAELYDQCGLGEPPITEGMSEREIEIYLFLWGHEQDMIVDAQAECIDYLSTGGQLH